MGNAKGVTGTGEMALLLSVLHDGQRSFGTKAQWWSSRGSWRPGVPSSAFMPHQTELKEPPRDLAALTSGPILSFPLAPWWPGGILPIHKGPPPFSLTWLRQGKAQAGGQTLVPTWILA